VLADQERLLPVPQEVSQPYLRLSARQELDIGLVIKLILP
jgi:hypothetical protein